MPRDDYRRLRYAPLRRKRRGKRRRLHSARSDSRRPDERVSGLDTIRGFALLGILLMNIAGFGLPFAAYDNPVPAGGYTGKNLLTWFVVSIVADGKMRAIFSMAFGASVYLLIDRLIRKGAAASAADIHYRRMLWLLLFGLIHGYLIWSGDILYVYAMCGLVLYPLRKLSPHPPHHRRCHAHLHVHLGRL